MTSCRGSCRRGSSRRARRRRCPDSARCRTRCCRSTASARWASSRSRPAPSCSSCPARGATSTTRRWRARSPPDSPALEILVCRPGAAAGRSPPLPPPAGRTRRRRRAPVRWYYYTSGTTADPKGAQHTDAPSVPARSACASGSRSTESDRIGACSRSPTSAAAVCIFSALAFGCTMIVVEGFDAETTPPRARAERSDARRRRDAVPHGLPRVPAQPSRGRAAVPEGARVHRRRRAEAAATALRRQVRARRRRRRFGLRDDRGADRHDGLRSRLRRDARQHRRRGRHRRRSDHGRRSTAREPAVGEEGEIRAQGADAHAGLHRLDARRGRVRRQRLLPHR